MSIYPIASELIFNDHFMDEQDMLKKYLGRAIDLIVNQNQKRTEPYFVVFHERSDGANSNQKIRIENFLPGFVTNQIVFWVSNRRGICEWLWTVPPKVNGKKMRVEFNTSGVAYLQAKGAMPS